MSDKRAQSREFKPSSDFPLLGMSTQLTLSVHTGSWRYVRPVYKTKIPPCSNDCPAGEDIRGYIAFLREGKYKEGLDTIRQTNPLPSVCGRVCFHLCELHCNRGMVDAPIAIHEIERFLGDTGSEEPMSHRAQTPKKNERVAVIGSGPAGLSCAYHLSRFGYQVTVFEALSVIGGMLRVGIPKYRLPDSVLDRDIQYILESGVDIKTRTYIDQEVIKKDLKDYNAIFIGIGAQKASDLNIKGMEMDGALSGLSFLKEVNFGKKVNLAKKVLVVGGGNTAIDCARVARRLGAEVSVIYRRTKAEMPANREEVIAAEEEGIRITCSAAPVRMLSEQGKISKVEFVRMKPGNSDEDGKRKLIPVGGSNFFVEVGTLISAVGQSVEQPLLLPGLRGAEAGIHVDEWGATGIQGVFAGGDVVLGPRTVAHAIGYGRKAAEGIDRFVRGLPSPVIREEKEIVSFDEIFLFDIPKKNRCLNHFLPPRARTMGFDEVDLGSFESEIRQEAERCFTCGLCVRCDNCVAFCPDFAVSREAEEYRIDFDYCKGCGICAEECPTRVISLEEESR